MVKKMDSHNFKVKMSDGNTYYLHHSVIDGTRVGADFFNGMYIPAYREAFWQNGMKQVPSNLMINIFQIVSLERIE